VTKVGINDVFLEIARLWNDRPKEPEKMRRVRCVTKVGAAGCCLIW
jgi:hypothetical protein